MTPEQIANLTVTPFQLAVLLDRALTERTAKDLCDCLLATENTPEEYTEHQGQFALELVSELVRRNPALPELDD